MPLYEFRCRCCDKVFDRVQHMNEEHIAYCCDLEATRLFSVFNTSKDLLWNFTDTNIDKTPIDIHSRGQYKRELKKRGLVQLTKDDRKGLKPPKVDTRKLATKMADKIYKDGAMPWVNLKSDKNGRDKLNRGK